MGIRSSEHPPVRFIVDACRPGSAPHRCSLVIEVIPERGRTRHPAFPRSISLCSYFVATTKRFYAEGASREDGYNSVSAPIVDRRGVAPGHDGGDRDAVGHERGRVVEGPSMLLTRRRGVSRHRMIVAAASGSVGGTIARRPKATSMAGPE
jgi:hypothetical protein